LCDCNFVRSELGKISLDNVFRERESLNLCIVEVINKAADAWGIRCLRYEIRKLTKYFTNFTQCKSMHVMLRSIQNNSKDRN